MNILKWLFGTQKPALNKPVVISSCGSSAETSSEAEKEILFIKNSEGKKERCLEHIKCHHIGFRDYEYEMALRIGDIDMFENMEQYYSEIDKEHYRKLAQPSPILHYQYLPFLGRVEMPTGRWSEGYTYVKNLYITNHDKFNERVKVFFDRRTEKRRIFNKQNLYHES